MGEIRDARLLYAKGLLFLGTAVLSGVLLWLRHPTAMSALLLVLTVWSACRAYYFAFYVVEHYVDGKFRFAGLADFALYVSGRR